MEQRFSYTNSSKMLVRNNQVLLLDAILES